MDAVTNILFDFCSSNNPAMDLLTEIAEYNIAQRAVGHDSEVVEPTVLLSLGTGVPPVTKVSLSMRFGVYFSVKSKVIHKDHSEIKEPNKIFIIFGEKKLLIKTDSI